jgi:hypothetical protein
MFADPRYADDDGTFPDEAVILIVGRRFIRPEFRAVIELATAMAAGSAGRRLAAPAILFRYKS